MPKQNARYTSEIPSPTLASFFFTPTLSVCTDGLSAVRQRDNQIFSDESFPISLAMRIRCARACSVKLRFHFRRYNYL